MLYKILFGLLTIVMSCSQRPGDSATGDSSIAGMVTGINGPESGVWVIYGWPY
jgi:hypothetical protein